MPKCQICCNPTWNVDDDDEPLCNSCKENRMEATYDRSQERLMEDGPGPTLLEQQIAALKIKRGL
jgi:hypothetical protein